MRGAASLHADRARLDLGEEFDDPGTAQFTFRGGTIFVLQRVNLKGILGNVDANSDIFPHGRPPSWWRSSDHLSALRCPLGGAVHIIKGGRSSVFDAFGCLRSLRARSALDGVSWVQPGSVEIAVGLRLALATESA